jgi:hypothetical protein
MTYKPGKRSSESPSGIAKLAFKKGKCLVEFAPDQDSPFAGRQYKVSSWPDWVKPKTASNHEWRVKLGKDEIYSLYPVRGMFTGKVLKFAAKEGEKPAPKPVEYKYGSETISYMRFTALLEITDGPKGTVGAVVPYTLRYYLGEDAEGNTEYTHYGKQAKYAPMLEEFLTATGAWEKGPIKFSDNVLPKLEKRIQKANHGLVFQLKNGWIVSGTIDRAGIDYSDSDEYFGIKD